MKVENANLEKLKKLHEEGKLVGVFVTSIEDYHNAPGVSKSALDDVDQAPAIYDHNRKNPKVSTDDMIFGNVLHTLVLEPDEFAKKYALAPDTIQRRGTKAWDEVVEENPGKIVLKHGGEHGYAKAKVIAWAARNHSRVAVLEGMKELSFFWKDPTTGLQCKCRPDNITMKGVIVDYKTTEQAYPERAWAKQIFNYRYHVQAAFYLDGVLHALEQSGQTLGDIPVPKKFVHYAQEKSAPFLVKPWVVGDPTVELGRRAYQANLALIKECETKKEFPGYPPEIKEINCPEYAWNAEVSDEN